MDLLEELITYWDSDDVDIAVYDNSPIHTIEED